MRVILLSTGVLMWASLCLSFGFYRSKIPNGYNVPDPCHEGKMWDRVGHVDREDGGRRNRFGRDFQSAGFVWNAVLCKKDSDGDGKTNGEELCDPHCQWQVGQPDPVCKVSHPGINDDDCL